SRVRHFFSPNSALSQTVDTWCRRRRQIVLCLTRWQTAHRNFRQLDPRHGFSGLLLRHDAFGFDLELQRLPRTAGAQGDQRARACVACYSNDTDKTVSEMRVFEQEKKKPVFGVIKAHRIGPQTRKSIAVGRIRNVYTIRDPRDAMGSMLGFGPPKDAEERRSLLRYFSAVLEQGTAFLGDGKSLVIRYEEMVVDPPAQVRAIARHLDLGIGEDLIGKVHEATGVKRMQKIVDKLEAEAEGDEDKWDEKTQIHVSHLQGGEVGRWRRDLTPAFLEQVERTFEPWMSPFGYGDDQAVADDRLDTHRGDSGQI
ncbi:MAG: hypothetical protein HOI34_09395, partial [Rhodospirillaceae bacterium]|nr:hypothetical protein [Rhodospirillaceae bacterium]